MQHWFTDWLARIRSTPAWLQDLVLAIVVSQADLVVVLFSEPNEGPLGEVPTGWQAVAVLLIATPLVFRRHAPELTMMLTGFGAGIAGAFGIPIQPLAPLVALYSVAAYSDLKETILSTTIFFAIITGLVVGYGEIQVIYSNVLIVLGVAVMGRLIRSHRLQAQQLALRATQLEQTREERAALAVRAERSRIAREMHDILAHSTSVMVVQASGARRLVRSNPDQAEQALGVVEDTGRETLAEIRRMLGLLRGDEFDETPDQAPTRPQPTLNDIPVLVEEFGEAGLPVTLRVGHNLPDEVDASVSLSAYRIVQEALTNVLKHSRASRTTVDLRVSDGRLEVEVLDNGASATDGGHAPRLEDHDGGLGLVGMRERANLVGGRLEAGPRPGRGWRVAASLPLPGHARADEGQPVGGRA